jgi:hypothetical protein
MSMKMEGFSGFMDGCLFACTLFLFFDDDKWFLRNCRGQALRGDARTASPPLLLASIAAVIVQLHTFMHTHSLTCSHSQRGQKEERRKKERKYRHVWCLSTQMTMSLATKSPPASAVVNPMYHRVARNLRGRRPAGLSTFVSANLTISAAHP